MRLELLHSFEASARTLSFTRAGDELSLTQSAVSRQIQQLEESLGVNLFDRKHRSLALTAAGHILFRATTESLERLRDARSRLQELSNQQQLAITCTPSFASLWLIPRLAGFAAAHAHVDVRISATLEVLNLERSQVDVALRFLPINQAQGLALFEETVQPLCSPSLARSKTQPLKKPQDLQSHTLLAVQPHEGQGLTVDWEPWLHLMGLQELRVKNTMRFSLYADAIAAAVAGQGVVIGRMPLLKDLLHDGRLVAPFKNTAAITQRGYYIELGVHAKNNPIAHAFVEWVRKEAKL